MQAPTDLQAQPPIGPLAGVRVLDLTSVGMGPYATQILGDMGAEVVKVESPEGDVFRYTEPSLHPGMSAVYLNLNRNKRTVTLDMKQQGDKDRFLSLLDESDVFVTNVRPKALARLGLGYEQLSVRNPRLIYCAAVGFGQAGPYAGRPAFDDIIQAMSGIADLQGRNGDRPRYVNTIVADKVAGLTVAYAIPMALYEREKSGLGQYIEVPMFETLVSFTLIEHLAGATFEPQFGQMGYGRVLSEYRRPYRTTDGFIALLPYTDTQWARFFMLADRPDLATDTRFQLAENRSRNFDMLYAALSEIVLGHSTAHWLKVLESADIPHSTVNTIESLVDDPHLKAVGFFGRVEHPTEGPLRTLGIPTKFSRTPGSVKRLPQAHPAPGGDVQF